MSRFPDTSGEVMATDAELCRTGLVSTSCRPARAQLVDAARLALLSLTLATKHVSTQHSVAHQRNSAADLISRQNASIQVQKDLDRLPIEACLQESFAVTIGCRSLIISTSRGLQLGPVHRASWTRLFPQSRAAMI